MTAGSPVRLPYASKFQEVQKYLSLTEHTHNFLSFIFNKKFYDGLTPDQQKILSDAAAHFVTEQRKMELNDTQAFVDKLKSEGVEVNELSDEQKGAFKTALEPLYTKYRESFGKDLFEMAEKYNK